MKEGLTDIARNIVRTGVMFPKETKKFMKEHARELAKETKAKARGTVRKRTGNLLKGIKAGKIVYEFDDTLNVRVIYGSPARHGHLIEYGHKTRTGFVRAYNIMRDTLQAYENKWARAVEDDLCDFIVKELER